MRLLLSLLLALALPAAAADPDKVLRLAFQLAESTFDPALFQDTYSSMIADNVFDPLLAYDYLARPAKLVPNTVEALPEVSADGRTYTFRLRKGIYFTPDPAFKGKRRELVAADYKFSIERFSDPKVKSPNLYLIDGLIERIEVPERYTLRVRLTRPNYSFAHLMALPQFGALAREVVEMYGEDVGSHPVGTGPYILTHWRRAHKMVMEANPEFREMHFDASHAEPGDEDIVRALAGKRLPIIGRIEIFVIEENQPRWLAFLNHEHDLIQWVPPEFINTVAPNGELAQYLARRGVRMFKEVQPRIGYTYFNINDPVLGGYEPARVALRRAILLAYNRPEEIRIIRKGQALPAQGPIPPGVAGYDPELRSHAVEFNPAKAKALLDMFGYMDRDGDGYRERPDGTPLLLEMGSRPDSEARSYDELWKRSMDEIGVRITFKKARWPDLIKESLANKLQMWMLSWSALYPDADLFMGMFYGPNSFKSNDSHFRLPEYDRLYERSRVLPDSAERQRLYQDMTKILLAYAPWLFHVHHLNTHLVNPWVKNYKKHPFRSTQWRYLDIDVEMQRRSH